MTRPSVISGEEEGWKNGQGQAHAHDDGGLPPHSPEAEAATLGCLILAAGELEAWERALGVVQEKFGADVENGRAFYDLRHRTIFQVMIALDGEGKRADLVVLVQRLRDNGLLQDAGGVPYLAGLPETTPSSANLEYYLEEVLGKFRLRQAIQVACRHAGALRVTTEPTAALERFEADVLGLTEEKGDPGIQTMQELVPEAIHVLELAYKHRNQGLPMGIPFPWSYMNKLTGGLHKRQVTVVGGESSIGKTSFMLNIVLHAAIECNVPVGILSPESAREELTLRMLAILANANFHQIHSGYTSESDFRALHQAAMRLAKAPLWIDDTQGMTPFQIRVKARRFCSRYKCQMLALDHIHECTVPEARGDTKLEGKMLMEACRWASRTFQVPFLVLAQLNREAQKEMAKSKRRRPQKSDLRESGYIEQMADNIGILYRDRIAMDELEKAGEDIANVWPVNLEVCKQRNGPTGGCELVFRRKMFRFEDRYANTGSEAGAQRKAKEVAEEQAAFEDLDQKDYE